MWVKWSLHTYEPRGHQTSAYRSFCSMKRLGVFVLPQGLDASLSKPYRLLVPILHLKRKVNVRVKCPQPGLEPRLLYLESSTLVMRPWRHRASTRERCTLIHFHMVFVVPLILSEAGSVQGVIWKTICGST